MRLLIILILFSFSSAAQDTIGVLGRIVQPPLLIIFSGESGSGGAALNSDATVGELAARNIPILNNTTLLFEPLDIGTNNMLGHHGFESYVSTVHGWELQLTNRYDDGTFRGRDVYIVKTGQGGSKIADWGVGVSTTYSGSTAVNNWQEMQDRVDAAIAEIILATGHTPEIILWYSQGINDGGSSTPAATWKADTKTHLNKIRAKWGQIPIYMMSFEFTVANPYDTQINEIASEMNRVFVIPTTGLTRNAGDDYHMDYTSNKSWADDVIDAYLQ